MKVYIVQKNINDDHEILEVFSSEEKLTEWITVYFERIHPGEKVLRLPYEDGFYVDNSLSILTICTKEVVS